MPSSIDKECFSQLTKTMILGRGNPFGTVMTSKEKVAYSSL